MVSCRNIVYALSAGTLALAFIFANHGNLPEPTMPQSHPNEPALDKSLPIVDPHHHFWDQQYTEAGPMLNILKWMNPFYKYQLIRMMFPSSLVKFAGRTEHVLQDYVPKDMSIDIGELNVTHTVLVESSWSDKEGTGPAGEVEWSQELHDEHLRTHGRDATKFAAGIVGFVDLTDPDVALATIQRAQKVKNFRGVRFILAHDDDDDVHSFSAPKVMPTSSFRQGLSLLSQQDPPLTFEIWCYSPQLADAYDLIKSFPEQTFILDHVGTPPGIGKVKYGDNAAYRQRLKTWKEDIKRIAGLPNVYVKLSGLTMPVVGFGYEAIDDYEHLPSSKELLERLRPFLSHTLESFGIDRCMFASNFPMDKAQVPYVTLYNAFIRFVREKKLSEDAVNKLFSLNAKQVYRLE